MKGLAVSIALSLIASFLMIVVGGAPMWTVYVVVALIGAIVALAAEVLR